MPNKRKPSEKKKKQKVNRQSADIPADRLARLRELVPEAFTEGKVDFDRLREALGEEVEDRPERYDTGNDFIYPDDFRDPLDTY